jgi:hypothetical protein
MVRQYPYELYLFTAGGGGQDVNGNFIPQTNSEWVKLGMCRDEVNSKGSQVMVADGTSYVFDSLIQCPKSIRNVHVGAKVQVRSGSEVRVEGTVSRFDPSQMHSRIWV